MTNSIPIPSGYKKCNKGDSCLHPQGPILPASADYFNADSRLSDGLRGSCKVCNNDDRRKRRADNPELYREKEHLRLERDRDRINARKRTYHHKEKERHNQRRKQNYWKDPEAGREKKRIERSQKGNEINTRRRYLYRLNPVKFIVRSRDREASLKCDNPLTEEQWASALEYWGGKCAFCGKRPDFWTILARSHWKPHSKGGEFTADNIIPLCHGRAGVPAGKPTCNPSLSNKMPDEWLTEKFGITKAREIIERIEAYFVWVLAHK